MPTKAPLLDCQALTVRFGGVLALFEVSFNVPEGSISALIGPNGAGKTTMLNAVTGMVNSQAGAITFNGRDISSLAPHLRAGLGIVRTFQNLEIFSNMTVLENVMAGCHNRVRYSTLASIFRTPSYFQGQKKCLEYAEQALDFVGLSADRDCLAKEMPFGNQRLLELARAIAARPKLLLLDEPAAGLNMKETRTLAEIIKRIRRELGITVALVEHDMDLVMSISDLVTVIEFGCFLAKGTPAQIQSNQQVIAAYLGEEA